MTFSFFVVSGFYAECPSKKVCFNAHIWTKSKFYGMSIGVVNQGEGKQVDQKIRYLKRSNIAVKPGILF